MKTDENVLTVPSKSNKQENFEKNLLFVSISSATDEKAGSGFIGQGRGSTDPDPYQNVTDSQHCLKRLYTGGISESDTVP